jgi:glycine cleavage system H protein
MHRKTSKDLYYTKDHEWVNFQGSIAYTGVCKFKLTGFRQIHKIDYGDIIGFAKQGDIIATIIYGDYSINAHMPVDGKITQVNDNLITMDHKTLLEGIESTAWLVKFIPAKPYDRTDLLLPNQYQMNTNKYAK